MSGRTVGQNILAQGQLLEWLMTARHRRQDEDRNDDCGPYERRENHSTNFGCEFRYMIGNVLGAPGQGWRRGDRSWAHSCQADRAGHGTALYIPILETVL